MRAQQPCTINIHWKVRASSSGKLSSLGNNYIRLPPLGYHICIILFKSMYLHFNYDYLIEGIKPTLLQCRIVRPHPGFHILGVGFNYMHVDTNTYSLISNYNVIYTNVPLL